MLARRTCRLALAVQDAAEKGSAPVKKFVEYVEGVLRDITAYFGRSTKR